MKFPESRGDKDKLLNKLRQFKSNDLDWSHGRAFGYVYFANPEITTALSKAYEIYFSENGLNPSVFPSLKTMESEVVEMCIDLFNGSNDSVGLLTSGGTESILMAVKAAKEFAKKTKGVEKGELIMPESAHPAFNKACDYFGIKNISVEIGDDYRAIPHSLEKKISDNTILIVGSAPSYPQGVVDPIKEIGALGLKYNIPVHVDSCVGGFVLPFIDNPSFSKFDLSVPGVTSISADIHKYGFASKGSSVLIYNNPDLRKCQFYVYTAWSGGIYASPSILGTKPGGAIAVAWTVLNFLGREGYKELVAKSMSAAGKFQNFFKTFDDLKVVGDPDMCIFSISSNSFDIYELGDELHELSWHLDRQQDPASLHLSISPVHDDFFEEFKDDFIKAYRKAKKTDLSSIKKNIQVKATKGLNKVLPQKSFKKLQKMAMKSGGGISKRSAAIYGMMGDLKETGTLDEMIVDLLDQMTRPKKTKGQSN